MNQLELWADRANPRSMRKLLESVEPAVFKLARRFAFIAKMDIDDLANEARLAAFRAFESYEPDRECKLFSYVMPRMEWALMLASKQQCSLVRLPVSKWAQGKRPRRVVSTDDRSRSAAHQPKTIGLVLEQAEAIASYRDPTEDMQKQERLAVIAKAMDCLTDRQKMVLLRRQDGETLEVISVDVGVSKERVRQIEAEATERLTRAYKALTKEEMPAKAKADELSLNPLLGCIPDRDLAERTGAHERTICRHRRHWHMPEFNPGNTKKFTNRGWSKRPDSVAA